MIKVINIKTGNEVCFSTLEGAEKTVKAFPDKYKFPEDVIIEPEQSPQIPDADREAKIEELVKQGFSREYAEKAIE